MSDTQFDIAAERAIEIAALWEAGKMVGGDEDEVRNTLLHEVKRLRQQLAESQALVKVLRDALEALFNSSSDARIEDMVMKALALPADSTALDSAIRQAKREALLEAAEWSDNCGECLADSTFSGLAKQFRRMADELKG